MDVAVGAGGRVKVTLEGGCLGKKLKHRTNYDKLGDRRGEELNEGR